MHRESAGSPDRTKHAYSPTAAGKALPGRVIGFATDARGRHEVAIATYAGGEMGRLERMTQSIYDECGAVWRPDGRALAYLHNEDATVSLRRVFAVSHADHAVSDIPGMHASPDI